MSARATSGLVVFSAVLLGCARAGRPAVALAPAPNPRAGELRALGKMLFFEPALSGNGRYVVSGAWDNTARVWEVRTQKESLVLPAHVSDVWATAFSPDGQLVATGGGDRKVKVWDAVTGLLVADLSGELHTAEIENLAFSPDGKTLASVSRDAHLKVWRIPGTVDRIGAYARYNYEKWARKGEFEKTVDFEARTARKFDQVALFQQRGLGRMLGAYANTAEWTGFTLKDYNADSETFAVASAAFPTVSYRVKISPREAEAFRGNLSKAVYGAPVFGYTEGSILLDNVGIGVAIGGATRQLSIVRQPGAAVAPAAAPRPNASATSSVRR